MKEQKTPESDRINMHIIKHVRPCVKLKLMHFFNECWVRVIKTTRDLEDCRGYVTFQELRTI